MEKITLKVDVYITGGDRHIESVIAQSLINDALARIYYNFEIIEESEHNKYWNNINKLQYEQTKKGLRKYGLPLELDDKMPLTKRIKHLQEELIDGLMYAEHLKALIQQEAEE